MGVGTPIEARLRRMNEGLKRKREQNEARERMQRLCQPWRESTRKP
jgi:hypothetical protein